MTNQTGSVSGRDPAPLAEVEVYGLSQAMRGEEIDAEILAQMNPILAWIAQGLSGSTMSEPEKKQWETLLNKSLSAEDRRRVLEGKVARPTTAAASTSQYTYLFEDADVRDGEPRPPWLIDGILREKGFGVIGGLPGLGKSTIGQDMALTVAQSLIGTPYHVIYCAFEGEYDLRDAKVTWYDHYHRSPGNYLYLDSKTSTLSLPLLEEAAVLAFIAAILPYHPKLVVIDTYIKTLGDGDENRSNDVDKVVNACQRIIRETGSAVLLIAHTNKGGLSVRGSNAITAGVDVEILLTEDDNLVSFSCNKMRGAPKFKTRHFSRVNKIPMGMPGYVMIPVGKLDDLRGELTENQRRILDAICDPMFSTGARNIDLSDALSIGRPSVHNAIKALRGRGYIAETAPGSQRWLPTEEGRAVQIGQENSDEAEIAEANRTLKLNWVVPVQVGSEAVQMSPEPELNMGEANNGGSTPGLHS